MRRIITINSNQVNKSVETKKEDKEIIKKINKAVLRNLLVLLIASRPVASQSNTPLSKIRSRSLSRIFVRTLIK